MAIAWADISERYEAGDDAATIAVALAADTRHVRDIKATGATDADVAAGRFDLLHVLRSQLRVLRIGTSAEWKGTLVDYFEQPTPSDPTEAAQFEALKGGFEELLTSLQLTGQTVYCGSDAATGYLVSAMTQLIGTLLGDVPSVTARIHALTGGPRYAGITEADVQAVIDQHLADLALAERQAAVDAVQVRASEAHEAAQAAFRAGDSIAEITAAAEASWDGE